MCIEIEGGIVKGLSVWWTPTDISLVWDDRDEEYSIPLTRETCGVPLGDDSNAVEWAEDDRPFSEEWIEEDYAVCTLEPGWQYRQEVTLTVEDAIELGVLSPAEDDDDLGRDGGDGDTGVSLLAAVWSINRRAKRCRDLARANYEADEHDLAGYYRSWKEEYYRVKGQALHYLLAEGRLAVTGFHRFDGDLWAEVIAGEGYTFHRPCQTPETEADCVGCDRIEAKPKDTDESAVEDALATVLAYLKGKPEVEVYGWPPHSRSAASGRFGEYDDDYDGDGDDDDECLCEEYDSEDGFACW